MLTTFDLDEYVHRALRAGAVGFLLKDTPPRELAAAVRTVAAGNAMLAPTVTRRLISSFAERGPARRDAARERLAPLTVRELEIVRRGGARARQRGDRPAVDDERGHREGARQPGAGETPRGQPGAAGHPGARRRPAVTAGRPIRPGQWRAAARRCARCRSHRTPSMPSVTITERPIPARTPLTGWRSKASPPK